MSGSEKRKISDGKEATVMGMGKGCFFPPLEKCIMVVYRIPFGKYPH